MMEKGTSILPPASVTSKHGGEGSAKPGFSQT